jgi:hypothetical protein
MVHGCEATGGHASRVTKRAIKIRKKLRNERQRKFVEEPEQVAALSAFAGGIGCPRRSGRS